MQSEEAWVTLANPELAIRVRSLAAYLGNGGALKDVRLVEGEDKLWTIYVRLEDRPGEHRVNMFKSDDPKTYRDVARAIDCIRDEFGYDGPVTLVTDRTVDRPRRPPAPRPDA